MARRLADSMCQVCAQTDLFACAFRATEQPSEKVMSLVRARSQAILALVKAADTMPWTGQFVIIREDNAFRFGKDVLPPAERAALWAEFDVEMERLYAVTNEGKEFDNLD